MGRERKMLDAADMLSKEDARAAVEVTIDHELKEARRMKGGQLGAALLRAGLVDPPQKRRAALLAPVRPEAPPDSSEWS